MTISEVVTILKDLFIAIAALTTASVAVKGLKNWNRELKGKAEFEAARSLIRATYKLRDQVEMCRSPLFSNNEFPCHTSDIGRRTPQEQEYEWRHAYNARWQLVWGALQEFDASTLEAEALWGSSIRGKTDELRQCLQELRGAIETFLADKASAGENFRLNKELCEQITSTLSRFSRERDKFSGKLLDAITAIESELRPHLKRS